MRHLISLQIAYVSLWASTTQYLLTVLTVQKALEDGKHKCTKALEEIKRIGGN